MAIVCNTRISSKFFTYVKETKTLVIDDSDLGNINISGQLYDDACDVGFGIVSERTGNTKYFYYSGMKRDANGDIQYWVYKDVDSKSGLSVKIFND